LRLSLLLSLFVRCVLTTGSTELPQLQALWILFFILRAAVINAIAHRALKLNCLAHIYFLILALPRFSICQ
jgi:hypothetical protein